MILREISYAPTIEEFWIFKSVKVIRSLNSGRTNRSKGAYIESYRGNATPLGHSTELGGNNLELLRLVDLKFFIIPCSILAGLSFSFQMFFYSRFWILFSLKFYLWLLSGFLALILFQFPLFIWFTEYYIDCYFGSTVLSSNIKLVH